MARCITLITRTSFLCKLAPGFLYRGITARLHIGLENMRQIRMCLSKLVFSKIYIWFWFGSTEYIFELVVRIRLELQTQELNLLVHK